jgi:hypothetical protein
LYKNSGLYISPVQSAGDYAYLDLSSNESTGHAGANPNNWEAVNQHVYAYSLNDNSDRYVNFNTSESEFTSVASAPTEGGLVLIQDSVNLTGSILLAKPEDGSFKGLSATAHFDIKWEFDFFGLWPELGINTTIPITVASGDIILFSWYDGMVIPFLTGRFAFARSTMEVIETEDLFQINLDIDIPYSVWARDGFEYSLSSTLRSTVTTCGNGTGAEVVFGDSPIVPVMVEKHAIIEEPMTAVILICGGIGAAVFKKIRCWR